MKLESVNSEKENGGVIISEGQGSELTGTADPSDPIRVNIDQYIGWQNRELYFQNTELKNILLQLERWYDLEFILPDEELSSKIVTVHIENRPLDEILELLSLIMDIEYKRNEREISFRYKTN